MMNSQYADLATKKQHYVNSFLHKKVESELVSCSDPTYERRGSGDVHPIPRAFQRNFPPPITLQKSQSVVQHRKFLATSTR